MIIVLEDKLVGRITLSNYLANTYKNNKLNTRILSYPLQKGKEI